ncbi:MAG TPA: HAMP domain-containing sensor histidine kinase [Polyangia bacterium]|nr:HAMP domain-containing sensor histidine kinase [Polyangia bacterium]
MRPHHRHDHHDHRWQRRRGARLRKRIWAHLFVVLIVGIFASGVVFTTGWRTAFIHSTGSRLARHVAAQLSRDWYAPAERDRTVRRVSEELDLDLTVRGVDGRALAVAGTEFPPLDARDLGQLRRGQLVMEQAPRFFIAAPVIVDGVVVGFVESSPLYRSFRMPSLWRPLVLIAVIMIIAGVASGPLARRISLPIERLTSAVRRFGEGDLAARVAPLRGMWHFRPRHRPPDELEQLTRAFNEMAERIETLVKGQKELLANVSHELRSPLARIRVALELLPRDAKNEARLRDVEADLIELDRLIEDVLTTTRLGAGGLPAHLGPVDVAQLFAQLVERAAHDPLTAGKTVRASSGEGIVVTADGALVRRALWNLVENAAKYGAPPIELSAERDGQMVALRVKDAGPGIAPEERERVFEPFYRGDKARTPGSGFGLGLTLARRVAEAHGGHITVDGATFTLRIPS